MKFQPLPIYGGSYADDTKSWSAQDVLGWLPSNAEVPGTKTEGMFKTPPGLRPFAEVPPTGDAEISIPSPPVRGAWNAEGKMFVVIGTTFYQLSNAGVFIPIGTIPGTGRVIFSHNQVSLGNQVLAVNGSAGYIYDTRDQTFQRITDSGYPGAFVATFIDGYFVQISANRRFAFNSDVANGLEYNTLDRFTSEFSPDLLVSLVASNNELFLLSETSGEFFENTGAAQQPFRSKRITMDRGCAGAYTVAKADNTVFWLGNNGYFYVLNGYAPQRISTRAIEQSILGKNWKQCFAFAWEDAGHTVIYWTFPDGLTWGYDTSTGLWHRRESYGLNRWRVNTMTFWNQDWYAGDFQYGRIWKMDWDYILEGDQEFPSERTTSVIHDNQNRIIIPRLELLMQVGQEETVPVEFPDQPVGPEVALSLPDGNVGVSWPGGSAVGSSGTPPYTYSTRPGTSFPGNLGPMSSAGVVPSEVPTDSGTGTVIVRVTDGNGLFSEATDTFIISELLEWAMSGGFTDSLYYKPSPDGVDWSENSNTLIANRVAFYREGDDIVGLDGSASVFSIDNGITYTSVSFGDYSPSIDRCGLMGGYWHAAQLSGGSLRLEVSTGTVDNTGITAHKCITNDNVLYTIAVIASQVIFRDVDWVQTGACTFRAPAQIATHTLGKGLGDVILLYNDEDDNAFLGRVESPTIVALPCPFTEYLYGATAFIKYSEGLGLWLLICGPQIAYGPTIDDLTLSAYTLPSELAAQSMDEDGTKFVIVGQNNLSIMTTDGITFTTLSVSDTSVGTSLYSVCALENSVAP